MPAQFITTDQQILWDLMPDEVKRDVEISIQQSKKGLGKPHNEVMKKYNRWLKK